MRQILPGNSEINASEIFIGKNVTFGKDVSINVRGKFVVGDNSHIGDRFSVNAEEVVIGDYFYNGPTDSRGMVIGGGSSNFPFAKLRMGDGIVCHTGHINLARPVTIGNNVGLSHDVDILTHGFWGSVLEGFPNMFKEVSIGNNVIVGWKTVIMGGVSIADNIVIGSHSTVTKSLDVSYGIYAGSPAKLVRMVEKPSTVDKFSILYNIVEEFRELLTYYDIDVYVLENSYPYITLNDMKFDVETMTCTGTHTELTDAFRDFLRRYGLRFFVNGRPFRFNLKRKAL